MGQQGRSAGTPLTPEDPPTIGSYELVSRLGSGGMGTVYLARDADGGLVALKAIRRDYTADPVYRARFHEEVSNARKVASFCTARVLDHGEHDGVLFLVTEYIDGVSLEDHLIQQGSLSPSMLHSAAVGVAAALTAIHAAGLVHRDLKPANVMLTLAGPRVIDFGLARSSHVGSRHTNAGMVMGTPGWIAPEQVFEGRTSPAGDVFAWGSLIALAGRGGHRFGEGAAFVMAARARTAPPDLRGLPAPLDRLVAAAIHPDPARRPTAKQLLLELVSATDEPAAQLAATRHLTDAWNPAEFPPLAGARPPHPPPGQPSPGPGAVPPAHRTGPVPVPPAHRTGPVPLAHRTGPVPLPPRGGQPPPHQAGQAPPPHQTGQGPLPPRRGVPPRFQPVRPAKAGKGVLTGCMAALVIVLVFLALLVAVLVWLSRGPAIGDAGGPVQDGRLNFAVTNTKCAKPGKAAPARTCRVALKVTNVGPEARVLYPAQQLLLDREETPHGAVGLLDKEGAQIKPISIGPGESFTGTLLFELPKDAEPAELELHDSALSTGVRLVLN